VVDRATAFWDRTYRGDPDFFGRGASSLARSSLGRLTREAPGGSLLELGCGTGRDLCYFAQHGFQVTGCDRSSVAVRKANLRLTAVRGKVPPLLRVTARDALEVLATLPKGRTDAVVSYLFFNLEVDPARLRRLFHGVAQVLRPGGLYLFSVRSTGDSWYGKGTSRGGDVFDPGTGGPPLRFFDEASLRVLSGQGFVVRSLKEHAEGAPDFPVVVWSAVTQRRGAPSSSRR